VETRNKEPNGTMKSGVLLRRKIEMTCPCEKKDNVFYGQGFGLGITPGQTPGESFLFGQKIVGWTGDTPLTMDPATGQMFGHMLNMTTGQYMPGVAMPTTVSARHGGRGPIATAPTGSGRVFWSPDGLPLGGVGLAFLIGGVVGFIAGTWYTETAKDKVSAALKPGPEPPTPRGKPKKEESGL